MDEIPSLKGGMWNRAKWFDRNPPLYGEVSNPPLYLLYPVTWNHMPLVCPDQHFPRILFEYSLIHPKIDLFFGRYGFETQSFEKNTTHQRCQLFWSGYKPFGMAWTLPGCSGQWGLFRGPFNPPAPSRESRAVLMGSTFWLGRLWQLKLQNFGKTLVSRLIETIKYQLIW